MKPLKQILIQAISSDIGYELAVHWKDQGYQVRGTYRKMNKQLLSLVNSGLEVVQCDLTERTSIDAAAQWSADLPNWDVLVLAAGTQDPVGLFTDTDIDEWEASVYQNFIGQVRFLSRVLPSRNLSQDHPPVVLMFAGGGTNSATTNYSAYTISKIACIKMCELLDAEVPDTIFTIVGPGWVDTKIHEATLRSAESAGRNYSKTLEMLDNNLCNPMTSVIECCEWIIHAPKEIIGGRNFSTVHDPWNSDLSREVENDSNNFKLRRFGNDMFSEGM